MKHPFLYLILLVVLISACNAKQEISIYCIGDSTMANKKAEVFPETGWCQVVSEYLEKTVSVHNHAVNGRSTKSFIDEGRWEVVLDSLKPGDYVFIQFGHNDQKDYDTTRYTIPFGSYTLNLKKFVTEARGKGAEPILFTSIVRRNFDENEKLIDTHGEYPPATRKVAKELKVPLIDLQEITEKWVNSLGDEPSKKMYLWTAPDERFKEGRKDDTHLSLEGAKMVAQFALEECKKQKIPFTKYLKN